MSIYPEPDCSDETFTDLTPELGWSVNVCKNVRLGCWRLNLTFPLESDRYASSQDQEGTGCSGEAKGDGIPPPYDKASDCFADGLN